MRRRLLLAGPLAYAAAFGFAATGPDAAVLTRIAALAPGHGLRLGQARVVGEFNEVAHRYNLHRTGPRGRDFSIKMAWDPHGRRALFAGANHGQPHRLNDVWAFDLAAMAWVLLYAPDNPRGYAGLGPDSSDVEFRDGLLVTKRGGPAVIGHSWSGLTFDPVQRCMLFMNTWPIDVEPLIRQVGGDPARRFRGPPLWRFDAGAAAWSPVRSHAPWPKAALGAMLEYVPELGGAVWHLNNWQLSATWLFESRAARWSLLADTSTQADFGTQAPGRELVGYHDPKRRLIVAQYRTGTFHFDTGELRWKRVAAGDVPDGHDARTAFVHDSASGLGLLADLRQPALWAYDADPMRWQRVQPVGDPMPAGERMLAYLDAALGVLVVLRDTDVWVYRPTQRRVV